MLLSVQSLGLSIECYQGDRDRHDLKITNDFMAIMHTNDPDESEVVYHDSYTFFKDSGILSAGSYIVKLNALGEDSALYKLKDRTQVLTRAAL